MDRQTDRQTVGRQDGSRQWTGVSAEGEGKGEGAVTKRCVALGLPQLHPCRRASQTMDAEDVRAAVCLSVCQSICRSVRHLCVTSRAVLIRPANASNLLLWMVRRPARSTRCGRHCLSVCLHPIRLFAGKGGAQDARCAAGQGSDGRGATPWRQLGPQRGRRRRGGHRRRQRRLARLCREAPPDRQAGARVPAPQMPLCRRQSLPRLPVLKWAT
jgi:hypothetical protein